MSDDKRTNPSMETNETTEASISSTNVNDKKVIDTYPEAERLITGGVDAFSRGFLSVVHQQVTGSTHELQGLDKVNGVINAQYSELKDNLGELSTYYKQFNDQVAALKPHLEMIDQLETVVTKLEETSTILDAQTKQLEMALAEVLV